MKNGKYGFFITAAALLLAAVIVSMLILPVCASALAWLFDNAEGISLEEDGPLAALAILAHVVVGAVGVFLILCAFLFVVLVLSILGLVFSRLSAKRAEKPVFRVFSIIFTVSHIQGIVTSALPVTIATAAVAFSVIDKVIQIIT